MNDQKKNCPDEQHKTYHNNEYPDASRYKEHEPSVLRFMVEHSWRSTKTIIDTSITAIRNVVILISAPWGIPYAGLVYNEMQRIYFENIQKKKIPYMAAPRFMMQDAIIGVERNKKIKKTIESRIRANNGGSIVFYIKIFFIPFHYTAKCVKERIALTKETMEYNETIMNQYQGKDGKIDEEKMAKTTMQIMELFARTFIQGDKQDEGI